MASPVIDPSASVKDDLWYDFQSAIDENNENRVEELIGLIKKKDLESGTCTFDGEDGYNLLRQSIQKNRKIAELLLDYGVKTNRATNQACKSPLHFAIEKRDLELVKKLLSKGAKIRAKTPNGKTPLYLAVELGDEKMVEYLLEKDPQPALNEKNKLQPIEIASENGNEKIFNMLVEIGARVDLKYGDGTSMFHVAVEKGYERTVYKIINEKNYDITDSRILTAAVMGWGDKYQRIVSTLVNAKFKIDPEKIVDAEFIHKAVEKGYDAIVEDLLKLGADPNILNENGDFLLITACKSKRINIFKTLIKFKVDFTLKNNMEYTILFYLINNLNYIEDQLCSRIKFSDYSDDQYDVAKKKLDDNCTCNSNEWLKMIKILIGLGIDVNNKDKTTQSTTLHHVAHYNFNNQFYHYIKELTALLIKSGADVTARDHNGNTPLQCAIIKGRMEMVELLLPIAIIDDDCYVNLKKETLLHSAVFSRVIKFAKMLLERKEFENVDTQDINGATPLLLAVQTSCLPLVEILLQHGANVNLADTKRATPLLCSLKNSCSLSSQILEKLLKFGANINCVDNKGRAPLALAALCKDDSRLKILIKYGVDLDARIDESGQTALHCSAWKLDEAFPKLLKLGADINIVDYTKKTAFDYLINSMVFYCQKNDISIDHLYKPSLIRIYTSEYRQNARIYVEHVLKLQTINSFVCPENLRAIYSYEDEYGWIDDLDTKYNSNVFKIKEIQKKCQDEVELMKKHTFENTNINIYKILTKCPHRVANYVLKNNNVIQQLQTPIFLKSFPIYCDLLSLRIEKCLERKKILDLDDCSYHRVFPSLPFNCIDEILSYLSNYDLKILISVCQLTMDCQDIESNSNQPTVVVASHVDKKQKI